VSVGREVTRHAEVGELEVALAVVREGRRAEDLEVDEEVIWLNVAVSDVVRVHVSQTRDEILEGSSEAQGEGEGEEDATSRWTLPSPAPSCCGRSGWSWGCRS
jgi:hypothetical protein